MRLESVAEIKRAIDGLRGLSECLLDDVRWRAYGSVVDLVFNNVWTPAGEVRRDVGTRGDPVVLRCHLVHHLSLHGALTDAQVLQPGEIRWGLSEVAVVRVRGDSPLSKTLASIPLPVHHIEVLWERARRLDVVFSYLEIERQSD